MNAHQLRAAGSPIHELGILISPDLTRLRHGLSFSLNAQPLSNIYASNHTAARLHILSCNPARGVAREKCGHVGHLL